MSSNNQDIQGSLRSNQQREKEARRDAEARIRNFNYAKSIGNTGKEDEVKPLSSIAQRYLSSLKGSIDEQNDGGDSDVIIQGERKLAAVPDSSIVENVAEDVAGDSSYEEYSYAVIEEIGEKNTLASVAAEPATSLTPTVHEDGAVRDAVDIKHTETPDKKTPPTTNIDGGEGNSDKIYKDLSDQSDNDEGELDVTCLSASDSGEVSSTSKDDEDGSDNNNILVAAAAVASAAVAGETLVSATINERVLSSAVPKEGDDHATNLDPSGVCQSIPEGEAVQGDENLDETKGDNMSTTCNDGEEELDDDEDEDGTGYCGTVVGTIAAAAVVQQTNEFRDQLEHIDVDGHLRTQDDDTVEQVSARDQSHALLSKDDGTGRSSRRWRRWLLLLCVLTAVVAVVAGMGVGVDRGLNNASSILIPLPTQSPTSVPSTTFAPSSQPSLQPSMSPSRVPSAAPTLSSVPSSQPTVTTRPTLSSDPSSQPSDQPTSSTKPSFEPSWTPSISSAPSDIPSISPTISTMPSASPSAAPSLSSAPSDVPSASPTTSAMPSASPSVSPTISQQPSSMPSLEIEPFRTMLKRASPKSADKLHRERAYQYKMMMWVYYETDYDNYTDEERLQLWALGCFFEATIGLDWDQNTNWMVISQNTTWCEWYGVTCNERRMVTRLELPQNHVQRNIPAEFKVLPALQYLGLAENSIGRLDSILFEMYTLEVIDLDGNGIETIPEEIPIQNEVKELYLARNRIREIPESISTLSKLEVLWLWTNLLEDSLPEFMGRMSNLIELDLEDNFLTGDLWPAAEMQSLEYLFIYDNIMGGEITSGFLGGNITYADGDLESSPVLECLKLKSLDMSTNYWYGTIPTKLANMVNMEELYLEDNEFSGTIAPEIFSLRNLHTLFLGTNYLSSALPFEIGQARSLKSFHAENNYREEDDGRLISKGIYGKLPATILNLTQIEELVLDNNYVEGTIMPELGTLQQLSRLRLVLNMLQGPIPSSLQNLTKLKDLQLWGNYMTGHLPNNLSLELERLQLHDNSFVGTIPPEWGRCRNLTVLDLSYNDLTGPVPTEFGNLVNMTEFYTEFNVLYGFMPEEVCLLRIEGALDELSANCDVPREDTPPPTLRPTRRPTRRPTLRPTWTEDLVRHDRTLQKEEANLTVPPLSSTPSDSPGSSSPTDSTALPPSLSDSQRTNAPTGISSLLPSIQVPSESSITSNPISGTNSPIDDASLLPSSQVSIFSPLYLNAPTILFTIVNISLSLPHSDATAN
ncbi:hypothetical protein ACHAXM_009202 [Skeletonema potamos]